MTLQEIETSILTHIEANGIAMIPEQNVKYYENQFGFKLKKFCDANNLEYLKDKHNVIHITYSVKNCVSGKC